MRSSCGFVWRFFGIILRRARRRVVAGRWRAHAVASACPIGGKSQGKFTEAMVNFKISPPTPTSVSRAGCVLVAVISLRCAAIAPWIALFLLFK